MRVSEPPDLVRKWKDKNVPKRGWSCVDVIDHEEATMSCQMCGNEQVRYIHLMEHPTYKHTIEVGCICAGHLSGDYDGARQLERDARNKAKRRQTWLTRKWKRSQSGNYYMTYMGLNVGVYLKRNGNWGARVGGKFGQLEYDSVDDSKLGLFEYLENEKKLGRL